MYFEFMEYSVCEVLSQYQLSRSDVKELYSTYTACSVINAFSSYTAIMLNSVTIYAMRKSSLMPKPLKTLLLSLAISDLGVGLLVQPFAIELLVKWTQRNNPSCTIYTSFTIILSLFSYASLFSVMIISADRFLAIHLHLRYQELVTYKRVVSVAISIWILSAFLSLVLMWAPNNISFLIAAVVEVVCLASTTFFNYKIYLAVRRHTNQIQALQLQIQEEQGHGENAANSASLQKSALGAFYVYVLFLLCYLPNICSYILITIYGSGTTIKGFFVCTLTLVSINSSLNPLIYCWKMRHVRRAIMDILRKILTLKERCC